jgi:ABC-2 type transport system ATP-binding protein
MPPQAPDIHVAALCKTFVVPQREAGLKAALCSLVQRQARHVKAVDHITFQVAPGEMVGFLGPNGAGKTTTLKLLSGLLHPSGGQVNVLGYVPARRDKAFLRQITLLMGQRNQLAWDLPPMDSFELNQAVYRIPRSQYRRTRDDFIELLEMQDLVHKPLRNLSLGERMKVEIAAALLHRPRVLFLDEPTIGLDVTMQRRMRDFIRAYNCRHGATVLLTSHYMADVVALCGRVIVIHHGRLLFDGPLESLVERFTTHKTLLVTLAQDPVDLGAYGEVVHQQANSVTLRVPRADTPRVTARLLADLPVTDLGIQDPPIEDVIERVFAQESV